MRVLPKGETPSLAVGARQQLLRRGRRRGRAHGSLVLLSTLDNLVQGRVGQAVQCVNLMRGLPEETGLLREAPLRP